MSCFSFKAWVNGRYVSIGEILFLIGRFLLNARWKIQLDELAPDPQARVLESIRMRESITTYELMHLVTPNVQIIDGKLWANGGEGEPVVMISAIDSTYWNAETDRDEILDELGRYFESLDESEGGS